MLMCQQIKQKLELYGWRLTFQDAMINYNRPKTSENILKGGEGAVDLYAALNLAVPYGDTTSSSCLLPFRSNLFATYIDLMIYALVTVWL